ncbi:Plastidial pyruvate kinase 1, chloroplastic [Galdieria sulphuraria]|nr:Plastidial pyruvate kinase 1, chloroplastic [Galdieria sulphuraria]
MHIKGGAEEEEQIAAEDQAEAKQYEQLKKTPIDRAISPTLAKKLETLPPRFRNYCSVLPEDVNLIPLGTRATKIVCTVGPSTCQPAQLMQLIAEGADVLRLNMSHGDFAWHQLVIENIREIVTNSPFVVSVMVDIGSLDSVRIGEFTIEPKLEKNQRFVLTIRHEPSYPPFTSEVSYDGFVNVVNVGDLIQIENGTVQMLVEEVTHTDVICKVIESGTLKSRAPISIRGKSYALHSPSDPEACSPYMAGCDPDADIEFAIRQRVEYIALSFVESAEQVNRLKNLIKERNANIGVVAKIESKAGLEHLEEIVQSSDAVMVARGDLGTAIPYEMVPVWQQRIVSLCRRYKKPCIISTHFLESMVQYPTPTRAEVTDIAEAVKQKTDALMLTTETASGKHPFKAIQIMHSVAVRMEQKLKQDTLDPFLHSWSPNQVSRVNGMVPIATIAENISSSATVLANQRNAKAILVFTQKGFMASLVSNCRPNAPIYAFTPTPTSRNRLSLLYGVRGFRIVFSDDPEITVQRAIQTLFLRGCLQSGDLVVVVADILGGAPVISEEQIESVFHSLGDSKEQLPVSFVRRGLRQLGLKISDAIEAEWSMRDVDLEDSSREKIAIAEEENTTHRRNPELANHSEGEGFTLQRFKTIVANSSEIIHSIQLRIV